MNSSNRTLFENSKYRLYSIYENVYLKSKDDLDEKEDVFVTSVYGDPDSGLISSGNNYIAVAGCGITIHFLTDRDSYELGTDPENILWTEGIYQSDEEDFNFVRFTAYTEENKIRVHRLDVFERKVEIL